MVLGQQWPKPSSSGPEAGERVGLARHAGKRAGADRGLVRRGSYWYGDGFGRSRFWFASGVSGRHLERLVRFVRSAARGSALLGASNYDVGSRLVRTD